MTKRILLAVAAAALLGACSSPPSAEPPVASLSTAKGTATSATTAPAGDAGRPQLRLDSSDEEVNLAWQGYYLCLEAHGHKMLDGRTDEHAGPAGNTKVTSPDMEDDSPQSVRARKECANKLPLQPPELEPETNPHYLDDYHEYMTCLTDGGLKVHPIEPFGTGWTYDDGVTQTLPEDQQRKLEHDCQVEAFSA
ncbi:hypothetical protein [Actinophytocola oryzae]|uniref:Subtilisin inhibitor-like n=1 Tax=Actinophytocola oryzae TaxID=502181 RepID=A0A4V3FV09_9PSEU|nr:hypothetical protein [Actinophytocola oryzae]TDV57291.1 hypothetical protein CLV71_101162 [Actinophytocola oryzae]